MQIINRGLFLYLIQYWLFAQGRQTDERWLHQPEAHMKVIRNDSLVLYYKYAYPPGTPSEGKLYFAHHIPETRHENILIEGKIDPVTGNVTLVYEMFPGKVSVTSQGQQFWVRVANMTLDQGGRYLTDVNFDTDAALHDVVDVSTFERPTMIKCHPTDNFNNTNDVLTFSWDFNQNRSDRLPQVTFVNISHKSSGGNWKEIVKHEKKEDSNQWILIYPDDQGHFKNRVVYAPGPKTEKVQLTLWDVKEIDQGEYRIHVVFEDNVIVLSDTFKLHVNPGYTWKSVPARRTLVKQGSDKQLDFQTTVGIRNIATVNLQLSKYGETSPFANVSANGMTMLLKPFNKNWSLSFDNQTNSFSVTIHNMIQQYAGNYTAQLSVAKNVVLRHSFMMIVLTDEDLAPVINYNTTTNSLEVKIKDDIPTANKDDMPKANIAMYKRSNGSSRLLHREYDTRFVNANLEPIRERDVTVEIQLDYTVIHETKTAEFDIPCVNCADTKHTVIINTSNTLRLETALHIVTIFLLFIILIVLVFHRQLSRKICMNTKNMPKSNIPEKLSFLNANTSRIPNQNDDTPKSTLDVCPSCSLDSIDSRTQSLSLHDHFKKPHNTRRFKQKPDSEYKPTFQDPQSSYTYCVIL